jgi:hypothetical protein
VVGGRGGWNDREGMHNGIGEGGDSIGFLLGGELNSFVFFESIGLFALSTR